MTLSIAYFCTLPAGLVPAGMECGLLLLGSACGRQPHLVLLYSVFVRTALLVGMHTCVCLGVVLASKGALSLCPQLFGGMFVACLGNARGTFWACLVLNLYSAGL